MTRPERTVSDLHEIARRAAAERRNVAAALRTHLGTDRNTPETIELSYDSQAGDYVRFAEQNAPYVRSYAQQLASLLDPHLRPGDTLLDAGAGELTTLSHLVAALRTPPAKVYACDISERRLEIGRQYAAEHMKGIELEVFRAELSSIPLDDKSVDVVTTNHAVEPNGGREREVLAELLRVARRKAVLFEPCYEIASDEGQARMRQHGYVQALAEHAQALGATVEDLQPLKLVDNPLNPTACYVIRPA